jgi:solute carrier family 45 protein 1/2/4
MGWFPFLFYSSSWVSGVDDTRLGSMALSIFAIISLLAGFVIPLVYPLMKRFLYQCHIWALSLLFFGILFLSTIMFSSVEYKIAVICCIGISWSVTLWVPFSLIGEYLNSTPGGTYEVLNNDEIEDNVSNKQLNAGVILGIHNMYICIPQFLSTFISMIVFSVIEKDSFGWAIRMGSISMIIAGYLAWNITDVESKRE